MFTVFYCWSNGRPNAVSFGIRHEASAYAHYLKAIPMTPGFILDYITVDMGMA